MSEFEDRKEYGKGQLDASGMADVGQFLKLWLQEAKASDPADYNAMTLSTVGLDGHPNARVVLLRSVEETKEDLALTFYTNYESGKGQELEAHPHAAVTFFWRELERQLRVRGSVRRMSASDSDRYFASRPRDSRIGAWASDQSRDVEDRFALEAAWKHYDALYPEAVPRPPHWGGFLLVVEAIEFWQGRPGRMHDRIVGLRDGAEWRLRRLQP